MTKQEALRLISNYGSAAVAVYEHVNGISKRGKIETKLKAEERAIRALAKHLTQEEITEEDLQNTIV